MEGSFTHSYTHSHTDATQGDSQLVRSSQGEGVSLRDTSTQLGVAGDRTSNLLVPSQPTLPPEPHAEQSLERVNCTENTRLYFCLLSNAYRAVVISAHFTHKSRLPACFKIRVQKQWGERNGSGLRRRAAGPGTRPQPLMIASSRNSSFMGSSPDTMRYYFVKLFNILDILEPGHEDVGAAFKDSSHIIRFALFGPVLISMTTSPLTYLFFISLTLFFRKCLNAVWWRHADPQLPLMKSELCCS